MEKKNVKKKTSTKKKVTKTTTKKTVVKKTEKKEPIVKKEVEKETALKSIPEIENTEHNYKEKRKYAVIGSLYIFCSILWFVGGILKTGNDLGNEYLDYISSFLLLVLGILYFVRAKKVK